MSRLYALFALVLAAVILLFPPTAEARSVAAPSLQRTQQVVTRFLTEYDLHHTRAILSLVTKNIRYSDCDYAQRKAVVIIGKTAFKHWLHKQFKLDDQFAISVIQAGGYDIDGFTPTVFGFDGKRSNDALRAYGITSLEMYFPKGVMNDAGTKIMGMTLGGKGCALGS